MDDSGVPTVGWGDVSVTARAADAGIVRCALDKMDPALTAGCRRPASGVRRATCGADGAIVDPARLWGVLL
jgi:hypothetical protein